MHSTVEIDDVPVTMTITADWKYNQKKKKKSIIEVNWDSVLLGYMKINKRHSKGKKMEVCFLKMKREYKWTRRNRIYVEGLIWFQPLHHLTISDASCDGVIIIIMFIPTSPQLGMWRPQ